MVAAVGRDGYARPVGPRSYPHSHFVASWLRYVNCNVTDFVFMADIFTELWCSEVDFFTDVHGVRMTILRVQRAL